MKSIILSTLPDFLMLAGGFMAMIAIASLINPGWLMGMIEGIVRTPGISIAVGVITFLVGSMAKTYVERKARSSRSDD